MARKIVAVDPKSGAVIDSIASGIIKAVNPQALNKPQAFDIESFFEFSMEEFSGVQADYRELPPGIHGYTDTDTNVSIISSSLMDDPFQENFMRSTMAHEIGHAIIHVPEFKLKKALWRSIHDKEHVLRLYRQEEVPIYRNPEWQAWRFAGAILMPEQAFRSVIQSGASRKDAADIFCVNPAFVCSRARALKMNVP
ncbi:MAG: ImmA/IrrE family metallo-endopeptidase [Thermoleophilia bacterium]